MKNTLIAVAALVVLAVGGWYVVAKGHVPGNSAAVSGGDTVATVNGQVITRTELQSIETQTATGQGVDMSSTTDAIKAQLQTAALDSLIAQRLLSEAAAKAGITASTSAVDAQVAAIKAQLGGDDAFAQALAGKGLTEEQLRSQISSDQMIQAYLEQQLHLSALTATDDEIKAYYDQVAAVQQGVPALATVKDQVKQAVFAAKQQQAIAALVAQLRSGADVKILI